MSAKIRVDIDEQGNLAADFIAFPGRSCEQAEMRLRDALARWGIQVKGTVQAKPAEVVRHEVQQSEQRTDSVWSKVKV